MMNNERQAGTKAATLMLHKFKRPASFFAMLLLCAVFCQAQDSVYQIINGQYGKLVPYVKPERKKDTSRVVILICDTANKSSSQYEVAWRFAYSVRELHNNTEGVLDPYFYYGFKYQEYWQHVYYITEDKKPLPSNWVVWQSVSK